MVSRSARAAYLSAGTLVVSLSTGPLGVPAEEALLWLWEEEVKYPVGTTGFGKVVKIS